jgi:hypothetical protein
MCNDLGPHRVANTVSVDEDVIWKLAVVVVSECLESALEVFLENTRTDDLLSFLALRACLCVVLAHVLVVGGTEANNTLFSFVANVNTYKHGLLGNFGAKVETP